MVGSPVELTAGGVAREHAASASAESRMVIARMVMAEMTFTLWRALQWPPILCRPLTDRPMTASRLAAVLWLSVTALSAAPAQTTWPTTGWPTATPQAVGLDGRVLAGLDSEIASGRYGNVDRLLVIRHGRVAFDRSYPHDYDRLYADSVHVTGPLNAHDETGPYNYYNPWWHPYYRRGDLHSLQSVTKTITSAIIGVAVTRGDFPSLDTPVLSFFDASQVANVDDRKRRMTVRHLLTMTAGFDWNEGLSYADPRNTATQLEKSDDWVKFTI